MAIFLAIAFCFMAILASPLPAGAGVKFDCYSDPGKPITAFQYANGDCGASETVASGRDLRSGNHRIVCSILTACGHIPASANGPPDRLTTIQVQEKIARNLLKPSMVMCKGTADYQNGYISGNVRCPAPSDCQEQVFYNLAFAGTTAFTEPIAAPASEQGVAK
jgi:hypothetical protein